MRRRRDFAAVAARVRREEDGCWYYANRTDSAGYAMVFYDGRQYRGHRFFYERWKGPVPADLQLHHLCGNRACVNPEHLEPCTPADHAQRHAGAYSLGPRQQSIDGQSRSVIPSRRVPIDVDRARWITAAEAAVEAADLAGVYPTTVLDQAKHRGWPSIKYRGSRFISRPAFEDWLKERRQIEEQLR